GHIKPAMIESTLMEYPGIDQAALSVDGDEGGATRLTAYITCNTSNEPSAEELRQYLRERFPAHLVPSELAMLKTLPMRINGRIDRRALAEMATSEADVEIVLAKKGTPYEELMNAIWSELFGAD